MAANIDSEIHKYDYKFGKNDGSAGATIVSMASESRRVLEIGAGPGSIARVLKDRSGCNLTAIEIDPVSVEKLKTFCDAVYCLDLNDENWTSAFDGIEKFDTIIAADILEHLIDPLATLKLAITLLAEHGQIIVSLPHVGHASVMACLFNSDFSYMQDGLLDRTHLRFFGVANIQDLFDDAGLNINEANFVVRSPDSTELMTQWNKLAPSVREVLLTSRFSDVTQVVVKASVDSNPDETINILALEPPKPRFSLARILIPNAGLRLSIRELIRAKFKPRTKQKMRQFARMLKLDL
ncbi:MAG: class I SAM-dependent methyltransferase [Alphaproteobacteria bacterium]|nr:class I SAM-dependent methyltransferase [Alphaproteobacteria bacterium]